jgi:hypothetical protein
MKRSDLTASNEPAATSEQNKPAPSMRGALVLILIIVVLLFGIYLLSLLGSGTSNQVSTNQQPQEKNWTLSPLVDQYNITQVPTIVINCKYEFVGSDVDVGKALCAATNQSIFCNTFGNTTAILTDLPECMNGSKDIIYAFHSPSCQYSSAQRTSLDALTFEFSNQLDVEYICTPKQDTEAQDEYLCPQELAAGEYSQ